jgi:acylphosphatase
MTQVKNFHIFVEGRVQGVGFRNFVFKRAKELGLKGWVRNNLDGRVEIQVSFPPQNSQTEADLLEKRFMAELRKGPAFAKVRDLKIDIGGEEQKRDFEIFPDQSIG